MARIRPFRAVRPGRDKAHLVGSRSYLSYSDEELDLKLNGNPYTFLHVIKPEMHAGMRSSMPLEQRYEVVREEYLKFREQQFFIRDQDPAYYVYRQTKGEDVFTGIIAAVAVQDYQNGKIKVHEQTITRREEIFKNYLEKTGFNAEPVLITFEDTVGLRDLMAQITQSRQEYEFMTTDKVRHEVWVVNDFSVKMAITASMSNVPRLYIADGHHRCASSALLAESKKAGLQDAAGYFMAYLLPQSILHIFDYNRLIKDLNGMDPATFIQKLGKEFVISETDETARPRKKGEITLYCAGNWYYLEEKEVRLNRTPSEQLDAAILTQKVLTPLLNIQDLKQDPRVRFINGTKGMEGIEKSVDSGRYAAGFGLFPCSFEELKLVSDAGEVMPPKSTWIEPKLRSGLTIYDLMDE